MNQDTQRVPKKKQEKQAIYVTKRPNMPPSPPVIPTLAVL